MNKPIPKSTEKTLVVFKEIIRKDFVVNFVRDYRKTLGIPEGGLEFIKEDEAIFADKVKKILPIMVGYLPKRIFPLPEEVAEEYEGKQFRIINTLRAVIGSQGYTSNRLCSLFVFYFFFNKIYEPVLHMTPGEDDLIYINHLPTQLEDYDREDKFLLRFCFDELVGISKKYPVAIYVNPEVTLNEMKDFLSRNWNLISMHRDKGEQLYSGKRKKPKQETNDFIYSNRDLPIAEIRLKLASELGEFLDDGHIGKVLSLESKRRK